MSLEFKHLNLEIKEVTEQGTFKGVASPFNNVDHGNDRVLPSISKRNNGKTVPYLWQHDTEEPIGQVNLIATNKGIEFEGKLFLDTNEHGILLIPKAHKAYVLMKNKQLKNSIGFITEKYKYTTEGKQTIRNLEDIDIKEVSAVTFPMNDGATIIDVKKEGGNKVEEEKKAMSFSEVFNLRKANENRWQLMDALNISIRQLMEDTEMKEEDKIVQLNTNIDEFAIAYKDVLSIILKAKSSGKKGADIVLEHKDFDLDKLIETKDIDSLKEIKSKIDKTIEKNDNKQEKKKDDTIETKAIDTSALEELYKNIVGNKEEN